MFEIGVFHNGASSLPVITTKDGVAVNDGTLAEVHAAAQEVIEVAGDVPDLWVPAGGERLMSLLRKWDEYAAERQRTDDQLREHLRSLREEDVPPLISD